MPKPSSVPPYERFGQHWSRAALAFLRSDELVYSTNITGQYNLWSQRIGPGGEPGPERALTLFRDRTVKMVEPAGDGHVLYFMADQDGDEQNQIFRLDTRGGDPVPVTDDRKVNHELERGGLDPAGRRLLYVDNGRTPRDMDVVLHDLKSGRIHRPLSEGATWAGPTWDPTSQRFAAYQVLGTTQIRTFVHDVRKGTTMEVLPHETDGVAYPAGWTPNGRSLLMVHNLASEFYRLELVDARTGSRRVLAAPHADVEIARISLRNGRVVYGVNDEGYTTLWSGPWTGPFRRVTGVPRGHLTGVGATPFDPSPDGRFVAVNWSTGMAPPEVFWIPLSRGRSRPLTQSMPGGVPDGPLPSPKLVRFTSFDGRRIPAFYYRPKRRPRGKIPAVLSIHGGPETKERPGWIYWGMYAYLNACGIAVLAPNIRGSTGYGKTYQKLIHRDWGGGELKDLQAAAEWLRSRPEIDRERLGVFGGSFGGFATLSCVTRLPEYWRVGVDVFGPSNLLTFLKTVPPFWLRMMKDWLGDPETDADFLRERSPINHLDSIRADLLILQGTNDPRVNKAESDQIVERLRAMGRHVEYIVFPDEGHGFARTDNQLKAMGETVRFLRDRLRAPVGAAA